MEWLEELSNESKEQEQHQFKAVFLKTGGSVRGGILVIGTTFFDKLDDARTAHENTFNVLFNGHTNEGDTHTPSNSDDKARPHQFRRETLRGNFFGYLSFVVACVQ